MARDFSYTVVAGEQKVEINALPASYDDWKVSKAEKYTLDKDEYVVEQFKKDFPHIGEIDFEKITLLVSQNKSLAQWYARINALYQLEVRVPEYLKEHVSAEEFDVASKVITRYNKVQQDLAAELNSEARKYEQKIKEISAKHKAEIDKLTKNKIVRILTMTFDELPLSVQLYVSNFGTDPESKEIAPNKQKLGKELLVNFKVALLQLLNEVPELDIEAVIKENQTK